MRRFRLTALLFLLSGGTALLYQVAFGKKLATIFGATAYAVSAVLAAFMGGLALGSHLGGRWGKRIERPLLAYGVAELVVGAVCAVTPWLFDGVAAGYLAMVQGDSSLALMTTARMLLTALVVVAPTVAMGATLPLLSRSVAGGEQDEDTSRRNLATLYAINTAGGALGALLSAYLILPALGVYTTMRTAALVNLAIGLIAIAVGRRAEAPDESDARQGARKRDEAQREADKSGEAAGSERAGSETAGDSAIAGETAAGETATDRAEAAGDSAIAGGAEAAGSSETASDDERAAQIITRPEAPMALEAKRLQTRELPALSVLAFASGLLVFSAEVVDTHLLALLIGNSAYAFGLMLAAFLTCLSAGAMLAGKLERRAGQHALPVALLLAALALLLTLPVWGKLPLVFLATGYRVSSWAGREAVRAAVAFMALMIPTVAMGLTFPLLLRTAAGKINVAQRVGRLTAINTLGSIVGSLLCGYVALPYLGSEATLRAVGLSFLGCGLFAAYALRQDKRLPNVVLGAAALLVVGAFILPRWDMRMMTNGANVYFDTQPPPDELVFVREDVHGGLTSVARRGQVLTLYTNGKFQGDNGHEVTAQRSFAHFPSLFVDDYGRVLVIGLGTGTTLGTVAAYPYKEITVAEISPAIVEAAGKYFAGPNRGSLADSRLRLQMNDGRNVLLVADKPYDLITIELTSVWFAGAANLYSVEFYQLCSDRLGDKGILQQWVQLHHIRRRDLAVVLRTMRKVFPHVALFVSGGQGIVVAGKQPLRTSKKRLQALDKRPDIAATLGEPKSLLPLLDRLLLSGPELDRFIEESAKPGETTISTDENLYLEYETPKGNVMSYHSSYNQMVKLLTSYRADNPAARHLQP